MAQLAGGPEEELVQGKFASAQLQPQLQQAPRANNTGLPDQLKSGIESLSGLSMDHVRVHYNSAQPAQLNALAYAQGSDIHVAPGQEKHLPHEAWHLVQQAQGRVRPTMQKKVEVQVNDDVGLEREADVMGAKALEGGHSAYETHRSISMPIEAAQQLEGDTTNIPDVNVANNDSAPLSNGRSSAQRGGNEVQRIADQRPEAALQQQVQAWKVGSEPMGQLRAWQEVADGKGVGGNSQDLTPGLAAAGTRDHHHGNSMSMLDRRSAQLFAMRELIQNSPRMLTQRRQVDAIRSPSKAPIQAVWNKTDKSTVMKWDKSITGIRWFYNTEDETYYYSIENDEYWYKQDDPIYRGQLEEYSYEAWHSAGAERVEGIKNRVKNYEKAVTDRNKGQARKERVNFVQDDLPEKFNFEHKGQPTSTHFYNNYSSDAAIMLENYRSPQLGKSFFASDVFFSQLAGVYSQEKFSKDLIKDLPEEPPKKIVRETIDNDATKKVLKEVNPELEESITLKPNQSDFGEVLQTPNGKATFNLLNDFNFINRYRKLPAYTIESMIIRHQNSDPETGWTIELILALG